MRIFLVRHGESLGNVDETAYADRQDHNVPLTEWGFEQAITAGEFIKERCGGESNSLRIWYSPFKRTQQTKDGLLQGLGDELVESTREDFLLREQDFGLFSDITSLEEQDKKFPEESKKFQKLRNTNGKFYAKAPDGESRADVAQRARMFIDTMMRDVKRGNEDIVIVAHGVTVRAIEMAFLHKGVQWFEDSKNPDNCDITLISGDREQGYTSEKVYEGKKRNFSLPLDYKTGAYGEGRSKNDLK